MAKPKSTTFILILITLALAGAVIGFRFYLHTRTTTLSAGEAVTSPSPEKELESLDSGPVSGTRIDSIKGVTVKGKTSDLNLDAVSKPKTLIYMPGSDTCRKCAGASLEGVNFLQEQLREKVAIYLLYTGKAYFPEHTTLVLDARITVVENAAPFLRQLKSLSPRIFFVDPLGKVKYFMNLPQDPPGWRVANQDIIRFVQTGETPK